MKKKNILIISLVIVFLAVLVLAADSYRLNSGLSTNIDEHLVSKYVKNNGAKDIFVPTKTSLEWSNFRSNAPLDIKVGCTLGSECSSSNYCDTGGSCENLPTCGEANSGTGYNPQESNEDLWSECGIMGCGTGNCKGGSYACGYYTFGQRNCFVGYECNSQGVCVEGSGGECTRFSDCYSVYPSCGGIMDCQFENCCTVSGWTLGCPFNCFT